MHEMTLASLAIMPQEKARELQHSHLLSKAATQLHQRMQQEQQQEQQQQRAAEEGQGKTATLEYNSSHVDRPMERRVVDSSSLSLYALRMNCSEGPWCKTPCISVRFFVCRGSTVR